MDLHHVTKTEQSFVDILRSRALRILRVCCCPNYALSLRQEFYEVTTNALVSNLIRKCGMIDIQ